MANKSGWWELVITDGIDLDDADYEHIGELIAGGYTSGEINQSEDNDEEEN